MGEMTTGGVWTRGDEVQTDKDLWTRRVPHPLGTDAGQGAPSTGSTETLTSLVVLSCSLIFM